MSEELDPIKADFRNFLYLVWKHLGLPDPTPVQYDIASNLQHGPKRLIIQAFRGVGKSWITSAFVCWLLYCNPQLRILVVSASKQRADDFSTFTKRLIAEMPLLVHLKPRDGQRDSSVAFDVGPSQPAHAPSVKSVGVTGQITGSRADVIIADDVEVVNNSLTQTMRDKLQGTVKEFDAVLTPMPASRVLYLGTPQTEMSLYTLLEGRGYTLMIWPARFPMDKLRTRMGTRLAPYVTALLDKDPTLAALCSGRGAPVDPDRFGDLDLVERESSYGRSGFAMQFMLDTSASDQDRYPLKLSDLIAMDCASGMAPVRVIWASGPDRTIPDLGAVGLQGDRWNSPMFYTKDQFEPFQGVVMSIDPAGRGGDELGFAIVAMLHGTLYLLECRGLKGGYSDDNLLALAMAAKRFGVKHIVIEKNFGDGMFTKLLTPFLVKHHPVTTEEIHSSIQKEKRIVDTLEPVMNQHRLVVDISLIRRDQENYNEYPEEHSHKYQLFYQMSRITKDRGALQKDDRLDALTMAVAYWWEQMDKDVQKNVSEAKERRLDAELEKFAEGVLGYSPVTTNWAPI